MTKLAHYVGRFVGLAQTIWWAQIPAQIGPFQLILSPHLIGPDHKPGTSSAVQSRLCSFFPANLANIFRAKKVQNLYSNLVPINITFVRCIINFFFGKSIDQKLQLNETIFKVIKK